MQAKTSSRFLGTIEVDGDEWDMLESTLLMVGAGLACGTEGQEFAVNFLRSMKKGAGEHDDVLKKVENLKSQNPKKQRKQEVSESNWEDA